MNTSPFPAALNSLYELNFSKWVPSASHFKSYLDHLSIVFIFFCPVVPRCVTLTHPHSAGLYLQSLQATLTDTQQPYATIIMQQVSTIKGYSNV